MLVLSLMIVLVALSNASFTPKKIRPMEKSTFDVLSAIANWIAAIANVTLFIIAFRTLKNDRLRIEKMEEEGRKKYAEDIYAWIEKRMPDRVEVFTRNGSKSAMYDVRVALVDRDRKFMSEIYEIELMKPLEELNFYINKSPVAEDSLVIIMFRDSMGNTWQRDETGRLLEISTSNQSILQPSK